MSHLRVFYELDGTQRWEDFEPVYTFLPKGKILMDYHRMKQRASQYAEEVLPAVGARKVSVVWDV